MQFDTPRENASKSRHAWLDHARGIGIILVVYGHQMRAQAAGGHLPASWDGPLQDALIYSFHMPLFFFISGIVSLKSVRDKPFGVSLADKLKTIAYPYFLWSIVSWCLSTLAANYVNKPMNIENLLSITYQPILQYWFLYVLFFCQMVVLVLRRFLVASVAIAAFFLVVPLPFVDPVVSEFVYSFPFFVIGMLLSGALLAPRHPGADRWTIVAALAAAVLFVGLACIRTDRGASATPIGLVQTWSGIVFVIAVSRIIGSRWSWLSALGQGSMAIFVLHTIVAAALRTILGMAGLHDPLLLLVICVGGAVIIPLVIVRIVARHGLEAWFGLGKSSRPKTVPPAIFAVQ